MRIGIITSPFGPIPPNALGAVERRWYNVGKEFKKLGHDVCFYSKADDAYKDETEVEIRPVKGYSRKKSVWLDMALDLVYTAKAFMRLQKCDMLVMNTFWAPVLAPLFRRKFKRSMYNVARRPGVHFRLYGAVDQFSCVSHSVQEELNGYISDIRKGVTVNNPVNLSAFAYSKRSLPLQDEPVVVGYHGRVHPEKGLDILCRALQRLSGKYNLMLRVIGPTEVGRGGGGEKYVEYLKSLCRTVEIEFAGAFSSQAKLNELLQRCHLYCYPSVASGETFGVSPLEAMATGLPTLVSGLPCFRDFIDDGVTGIVFDHTAADPAACLAEKIEMLISDYATAQEIGRRGYERSKDFSNRAIAEKYLANFEKLLES